TIGNPVGRPETAANGADILDGGDGIDVVRYAHRLDALRISIDGKRNDGAVREHDNVHLNIENVVGGLGADLIVGSDGDNELSGGLPGRPPVGNPAVCQGDPAADRGNDTIHGLGGNDIRV